MICGVKWKSCDCPWFNHGEVENDRLRHMRPLDDDTFLMRDPFRAALPQPRGYRDELLERRRREIEDEHLARRLQILGFDDDDYNGGIGNVEGVGNAAAHFMNEDFRRPPINVRDNLANRAANLAMANRGRGAPASPPQRPAERVVPRRTGRDYATEAEIYAPRPPARESAPHRRTRRERERPKDSVLAGLPGRGSARVGTWATYVEPGPPEGGAISQV
jgi:hypothetical protein